MALVRLAPLGHLLPQAGDALPQALANGFSLVFRDRLVLDKLVEHLAERIAAFRLLGGLFVAFLRDGG